MDPAQWTSATRALITTHEGRRRRRYFDKYGHASIGIGFNLERPDAHAIMDKLGANWTDIINGRAELTDNQVDTLFDWCYTGAVADARAAVSNFGDLIPEFQTVLVDMAFQLGIVRLRTFRRMIARLWVADYAGAVAEIRSSLLAKQDPARVHGNCLLIEDALRPKPPKAEA